MGWRGLPDVGAQFVVVKSEVCAWHRCQSHAHAVCLWLCVIVCVRVHTHVNTYTKELGCGSTLQKEAKQLAEANAQLREAETIEDMQEIVEVSDSFALCTLVHVALLR